MDYEFKIDYNEELDEHYLIFDEKFIQEQNWLLNDKITYEIHENQVVIINKSKQERESKT
jgi:hypothetical protein